MGEQASFFFSNGAWFASACALAVRQGGSSCSSPTLIALAPYPCPTNSS